MTRRRRPTMFVVLMAVLSLSAPALPQDSQADSGYRIGAGDVLRLNVPAAPQLDRDLTVQPDGTVYVSQVGALAIGGLTVAEAREVLGQRLGLFNPQVDSVVLTVVAYNALKIFVLGAVNTPGAYPFTSAPTAFEVLRAAGGPSENVNLSAARVITTPARGGGTRTVNLAGFLSGENLPAEVLQAGDTLILPSIADGTVGVAPSHGVQVFGGVRTPTTVPLEAPTPLLTVLMLAGAPLADAQLNKVSWVHLDAAEKGGLRARRIDLTSYLDSGKLDANPLIHPGDTVYLPQRQSSWLRENLPLMLSILTAVSTAVLVADNLRN